MRRAARGIALLLLAALWVPAAAAAGEPGPDPSLLHEKAIELLRQKRYEESIRVYAEILRASPEDATALYNVACACSLMGKKAHATGFLEKAVEAGFIDFEHIEKDSDLDAIRGEAEYLRILENREAYVRKAEGRRESRLREKLGDRYAFTREEKCRLLLVTNVDKTSRERLLDALRRYSEALGKAYFPHKPGGTITVLVPKNWEDYAKEFGGRAGAAGFYESGTRTLTVNLVTGTGTMIHEYTHALHYGDQEGLKQSHPIWIVEGFGSLFEQCTIREDGTPLGLTNWRLPPLQQALRDRPDAYIPWRQLMDPKSGVFRNERVGMAYAVTRYIFYYMQEKGVLAKFYKTYRERFAEDPIGVKFVEEVFGKKLDEIEAEWKPWVLTLRFGAPGMRTARQPKVRLGIQLAPAEGGAGVGEVTEGSCAEKAGLKAGDVIVEFDGKKVESADGLLEILLGKEPGDKVKIKVLREGKEVEAEAALDKRP